MNLQNFLKSITWNELKDTGSDHYKSKKAVEPVDLYRTADVLGFWACSGAIRRAYRIIVKMKRRRSDKARNAIIKDTEKVIHEMLFFYVSLRDK